MPTCKDCLHYDLCKSAIMDSAFVKRINGFIKLDEAEEQVSKEYYESCNHFKDRSKFIGSPCKVGDVVYHYCEELHEILDYTVYCIDLFRDNGITYHADAYDEENAEALSDIGFEPEDIGRDVFLAREETERAIKEEK